MYYCKILLKIACLFLCMMNIVCIMKSALWATEITVYRNESMPWCGTVNGKDAGITVDILNEVTKNGGPKFIFQSLPWKRAQYFVKRNKGTAIIPLTRTLMSEKHFNWIINLVPNNVRLTMARTPKMKVSRPASLSLSDFKGLRVGIIRGSAMIPILKELGFRKFEKVNTAEMNVKKLIFGRIDAMAESQWVDNYLWKQIGQKDADLIVGPYIGDAKYIYLAASLDFPKELNNMIKKAMDKVRKSGRLEIIMNSWR